MKYPPLTIHLGSELWEESLVAGLTRLGHTVVLLNTEAPNQVWISRKAWRIPKDVNQAHIVAHIETVLKQVRLLEHEDSTKDQPTEEPIKAKPAAKKRKPVAKKAAGGSSGAAPEEGSVGSTS